LGSYYFHLKTKVIFFDAANCLKNLFQNAMRFIISGGWCRAKKPLQPGKASDLLSGNWNGKNFYVCRLTLADRKTEDGGLKTEDGRRGGGLKTEDRGLKTEDGRAEDGRQKTEGGG
jgi:hypothetical protein